MYRTIGTCSICGGPVVYPESWLSVLPPVPYCLNCGAVPKQVYGPVIPMKPNQPEPEIDQELWSRKHHKYKYECRLDIMEKPGNYHES